MAKISTTATNSETAKPEIFYVQTRTKQAHVF